MKELTVYELCGNHHYIFAKRNADEEITVEILDENDQCVYLQKGHYYAWEGLVSFAKMILQQDKQLQREKEALENQEKEPEALLNNNTHTYEATLDLGLDKKQAEYITDKWIMPLLFPNNLRMR